MALLQTIAAFLALIWSNLTLEPALFVIRFANKLDDIPLNELLIYKVCINKFNFTEHICDNLLEDEFYEQNQAVQYEFTKYTIILSTLQSVLPTAAALYFGAWGDIFGRKFILATFWITRLMGEAILQVNAYWRNGPPELYVINVIPNAIIGGWGALWLGQTLFICDITPPENRAFRFAMLAFASSLASPIGTYFGAIIYQEFGIVVCLTLSLVVQVIGVSFMFWKIRGYKYEPPKKVKKTCGTIFDPKLVKDSIKTAFKKRPGPAHFMIYFLLVSSFFLYAAGTGEGVIGYVFLRDRFKWGPTEIAKFSATLQTWGVIVQGVINPLLKLVKIKDIKMMIGFVSLQIVSDILVFFAHEPWMMYFARMVDGTTSYAYFVASSLYTCCTPVEELGRLSAIFGIADNFNPLFIGPIYRELYWNTIDNMMGAPYLLSASCGFVYVLMMSFLLCKYGGKSMAEITGYGTDGSTLRSPTEHASESGQEEPTEEQVRKLDTFTRATLSMQGSIRSRSLRQSTVTSAI